MLGRLKCVGSVSGDNEKLVVTSTLHRSGNLSSFSNNMYKTNAYICIEMSMHVRHILTLVGMNVQFAMLSITYAIMHLTL